MTTRALKAFAVLLVILAATFLIYCFAQWIGIGSPVFAFNFHFILMAAAHFIIQIVSPKLTSHYFNVMPWEVRLYQGMGVIGFMRMLRLIGWTSLMRDDKIFDGSRRTIASYEYATRAGEVAHAWLLVIALTIVAWFLLEGWGDAALWIGTMSILFHLYPVMLQRTQRVRLQLLIKRMEATKCK